MTGATTEGERGLAIISSCFDYQLTHATNGGRQGGPRRRLVAPPADWRSDDSGAQRERMTNPIVDVKILFI